MISEPKTYNRGQVIFQQGDPAGNLFIVRSGIVSLFVRSGEESIEIAQVSANQILGEEILWGVPLRAFTAVANNPVNLLAMEAEAARSRMNHPTPLLRALSAGILSRHRRSLETLLELKLRSHPIPCPDECIVKLFAVLYHCASYTGTRKGALVSVVWPAFKKYAQRTFLESPVRLEQAVRILVKLGYARLEYVPCEEDPNAPDELGFVHFTQLDAAKSFFEFYRALKCSDAPLDQVPPEHQAILAEIALWNSKGKVEIDGEGLHAA